MDLATELPKLLPLAIAWAEARSDEVAVHGVPLTAARLRLARSVGVQRPEAIRISEVHRLPLPDDPGLRRAAVETGLLGPRTVGVTFGYSVLMLTGHGSNRLISHECRHVHQYEQAGSIAAFLPLYLNQIATVGYSLAPFEIDARSHERDDV